MKRKKCLLIICCLLLLLLCSFIIVFFFKGTGNKILLPKDNSAEEWNGDQKLPSGEKSDEKTIKIPGISSLVFIANQKEQKVNFYNPKENTCLFRMTLYIEENPYWQSGYIDPGKGYYSIALDNVLKSGDYNGYLLIECFKDNGTALNNAKVEFQLKVVDE